MNITSKFLIKKEKTVKFFIFILLQIICIYLVNKIEFGRKGIGNSLINFLKFDFILITFLSLSFLMILKDNLKSYVFLIFTTILFYVFVNEFYINFKRIPKIAEITEIPELLGVLSTKNLVLFIIFLLSYLSFFIHLLNFSKRKYVLLMIIAISLHYTVKTNPKLYINIYNTLGFEYIEWDLKKSVRLNGYLNFMIYEEAKRNLAIKSLSEKQIIISKFSDNLLSKINKKNIHLIVLESFYDPNMFEKLTFSKNPIHNDFLDIYEKQNISNSPVYGGGTAQAEFELLTGAPALHKYSNVEFNLFTGNVIDNSLPERLNNLGYTTIATNSLTPNTFNSQKAYESLGFQKQYYLSGKTYLKKSKNDRFIFDGDLFNQNIQFLVEFFKKDSTKVVFNYVLGMYGHSPNTIDTKRHSEKIDVFFNKKKLDNEKFSRSINQIYYRTLSLSNYIKKLNKLSPNSLIIIISDQLPLVSNINKYGYYDSKLKKVPFYIINDSKPIKINEKEYHHYNITDIILNSIIEQNITSNQKPEDKYDEILYQAIQSKNSN